MLLKTTQSQWTDTVCFPVQVSPRIYTSPTLTLRTALISGLSLSNTWLERTQIFIDGLSKRFIFQFFKYMN